MLQNSRVLISNMVDFTLKHTNKAILALGLKVFLHKTLEFLKFKPADLKHAIIAFSRKFQPKITQTRQSQCKI